ncbi:MAG: thiosulfate oxidation carrier protein SoxY [Pseudomonadota bacterium]
MKTERRDFVKTSLAAGFLSLFPPALLADWPKEAFDADTPEDVMKSLLGATETLTSEDIEFVGLPEIAENGAVVPVGVNTTLSNIESISIIVEKNPAPLIASFKLGASAVGAVSTRMKMGATSNVIAIVKADGKLYSASKEVKVTIGGCGG